MSKFDSELFRVLSLYLIFSSFKDFSLPRIVFVAAKVRTPLSKHKVAYITCLNFRTPRTSSTSRSAEPSATCLDFRAGGRRTPNSPACLSVTTLYFPSLHLL